MKGEFDSITIFSFAIHEFSDLLPMNFIKKDIERVFLTEVGVIPKNVLIHSFRKHFKFHMSMEDFHDFSNNKGMSFQIHMMEKIKDFGFDGDSFVLIDDMVDDMEMSFKGNKIKTINVESL